MTPAVSIRPAVEADIDAVLALWRDARSIAAATPDTHEGVRSLIAHTTDALLVAEFEHEIVGTVIAAWDGWRGNIYRLTVRPDRRRLGIGLVLVREGEERLRAKGARRVTALVAGEEVGAAALWRAAGYEHEPDMMRFARNF